MVALPLVPTDARPTSPLLSEMRQEILKFGIAPSVPVLCFPRADGITCSLSWAGASWL